MMITDPVITGWIHPGKVLQYCVEGFFALGVLALGKLLLKWKIARAEKEGKVHETDKS
jgi:hypothetical protein